MSSTEPYVILAEDDPVHAKNTCKKLTDEFAGAKISRIRTEHEFRSNVADFVTHPPDVIVVDVMLRWTDSTAEMVAAPADVKDGGGYHRAGFRCIKLLADNETTQQIPCIVYTVLARSALDQEFDELPSGLAVEYLQKESDRTSLFNLIRKLTRRRKSGS